MSEERISPKRRVQASHTQKFTVGMAVSKDFGEELGGVYEGKIDAFDAETGFYTVKYEDSDTEEYDQEDIEELLLAEEDNQADEEDKAEIAKKKQRQQAKKKKAKTKKSQDDEDDDEDSDNENNGSTNKRSNKKKTPSKSAKPRAALYTFPSAPPTLPTVSEFPTVASYVASSSVVSTSADDHPQRSPSPPPLGSCLYDDY